MSPTFISRASRVLLVVTAAGSLLAGCGGSTAATGCRLVKGTAATSVTSGVAAGSWPHPNADLANTRDALGSTISSADVSRLRPAWTFKLTGPAARGLSPFGSLVATPIVRGGVVYIQDLDSDVYALSLTDGKLRWEYQCDRPERSGPGPNGVAIANGVVYGQTPTAAFALSAATGRQVWWRGDLLHEGEGTFGIAPQVAAGRVYLASQYGSGPGGGVLMALDASTGVPRWTFRTVLTPDAGVRSVGLGSGGAWETPLVSGDGSVTYGIGNPYQTPIAAIDHPSPQLYTDSDVNLDAATGRLRWYYQGVPNDFEDHDMQASPISTVVHGVSVVIGSGKMGYVYEMDAATGKLIWKTPVGQHNGHDSDSLQALQHRLTLKAPYTILPGSLGGVLSNLAVAAGRVYVATIDLPLTYTDLHYPVPVKSAGAPHGEVEALDLATGRVEWDAKVSQLPLGAATVSNDLVLTTLYDGVLVAFDRRTGAVVYRHRLPTSTNAAVAVAGNTVIVPAGGPFVSSGHGNPQVVAYTLR